jgi:hypothetical protein
VRICFAQVPLSYWGSSSDEGTFLFHKGQLLTGCLDKAQFGKFGLVHAMQVRSWGATNQLFRMAGVGASDGNDVAVLGWSSIVCLFC